MNAKLLPILALSLLIAACAPATGMNGDPNSGSGAVAEQYISPDCQLAGCSAQICQSVDEEPMASDCMFRPAYECYKTGRCEKQATGECGWTMTDELSACLMDPPTEDPSLVSA